MANAKRNLEVKDWLFCVGSVFMLPRWVACRKELGGNDKIVLMALLWRMRPGGGGNCFPSQGLIGSDCGLGLRTVVRSIAKLELLGLLKSKRRGFSRTNAYELGRFPREWWGEAIDDEPDWHDSKSAEVPPGRTISANQASLKYSKEVSEESTPKGVPTSPKEDSDILASRGDGETQGLGEQVTAGSPEEHVMDEKDLRRILDLPGGRPAYPTPKYTDEDQLELARVFAANENLAVEYLDKNGAKSGRKTSVGAVAGWKSPTFVRYWVGLRNLRWPATNAIREDYKRSASQVKMILNENPPEFVKQMIENVILNWPGVRDKYRLSSAHPTFGILLSFRGKLVEDTRAGGTVTSVHRVSYLSQGSPQKDDWWG